MKQVGIWLNQKEADIITLENAALKFKTIYSDIDSRERIPGESKQFGRFGDQFLSNENDKKNKINDLTQKYLNAVVTSIRDANEIMIFGPAQTKVKLKKLLLKNPSISSKLKEIKSADHMTENQKVAFVKNFYTN
jgi:hypothetical protein